MDAVLNWVLQGSVLALAACGMLRALSGARAAVRYGVCWTSVGAVLALPALPILRWQADVSVMLNAPAAGAIVLLPDTWWTSTLVLFVVWLAWTAAQAARFARAGVAIRRARAASRPFPAGLESALPHWNDVRSSARRATVVVSDAIDTAALLGCGSPVIAVSPTLLERLDTSELDRVLIHEWAHVQRRDDLLNVAQIVVRALVGWHPAIWWLDRRMHVEREMACDEMTVAVTGSAKTYAACLVKLAGVRGRCRALSGVPAALTASGLRQRILNLVTARRQMAPRWARAGAATIGLVLCMLSLGLGELKIVEASVLALPVAPAVALRVTLDRLVPVSLSGTITTTAPVPTTVAMPEPARRETVAVTPPVIDSPAHLTPPVFQGGAPAVLIGVATDPARVPQEQPPAPVVQRVKDAPRPTETAATPVDAWSAAAAAGKAIGRSSKNAGISTGGFFTRAAKRLAGAF